MKLVVILVQFFNYQKGDYTLTYSTGVDPETAMTRERIIHGLGLIGLTYHFLARQNTVLQRAAIEESPCGAARRFMLLLP